jgi:hypothetical protein
VPQKALRRICLIFGFPSMFVFLFLVKKIFLKILMIFKINDFLANLSSTCFFLSVFGFALKIFFIF